jgi:hypothetical protein
MFSIENFYYVLYTNLLEPLNINGKYFYPFGSTDVKNIHQMKYTHQGSRVMHDCVFHDQEPIINNLGDQLVIANELGISRKKINILANSEYSQVKRSICKNHHLLDWYYFYHGFAALDWYRDYQYFSEVECQYTKVFMSLNRLVTNDRSYRLVLASLLLERNLIDKGVVSLHLADQGWGDWKAELSSTNTKLSPYQIELITKHVDQLSGSIIADTDQPRGSLSADAGPNELAFNQSALWHIVSETVFYYNKLHLTEKTFKPIVSKRPFILVAAPGNLVYLKNYGFQTFDRWIDESYDTETDNQIRLEKIAVEVEKLCNLSPADLKKMHQEMREILEFNFNHFYGEFKTIIVRELLDNFKGIAGQWNNGRVDGRNMDLSLLDFPTIEKRLLQ